MPYPLYILLAIPGLILSLWAAFYTKATFARFAKVRSQRGMSGAEAAAEMLRRNGVRGVEIEPSHGFLSDHYDPASRKLRLSPQVYSGRSLSAIGVACHEAGHALQHAHNYAPLGIRSALVPVTNIGSYLAQILFVIGFLMRLPQLFLLGAIFFMGAVVFSLVTLPVEWNATARAKACMVSCGIVSEQERMAAGQVLNAAFMTYVAAAVTALLTLLYYLLRAGVLGGRDD